MLKNKGNRDLNLRIQGNAFDAEKAKALQAKRNNSVLPKRHWTVELVLVDQPDQAYDECYCGKGELEEALRKGLSDLSAGLSYKYLTVKRARQEDKP